VDSHDLCDPRFRELVFFGEGRLGGGDGNGPVAHPTCAVLQEEISRTLAHTHASLLRSASTLRVRTGSGNRSAEPLLLFWIPLVAAAGALAWRGNNRIVTTYYTPESGASLSGCAVRVAQVSDLHVKRFGRGGQRLVGRIRAAGPDVIAVTGDILDHRRELGKRAHDFIVEFVSIAPVFLITGNHEFRSKEWDQFRTAAEESGAVVLDNCSVPVTVAGKGTFTMAGVHDFMFFHRSVPAYREALRKLSRETANFPRPVILLAHRPEHFRLYAEAGFDYILSGHAHGGQVRLPGLGPLFAPNEGLLPKLAQGVHCSNGSHMIVSRGLGGSRIPLRILNPPELVIIDVPV